MTTLPLPDSNPDVLIIGAGLAALSVALSLPTNYRITLLAKSDLTECASCYAQGGIAAVMDPQDSVAEHIHDTLVAGAGLCDPVQVSHILSQAAKAIEWLCQLQVPFSREDGVLHLTREGGHSKRRIAHAADHTGLSITTTLQQHMQQQTNIQVLAHSQLSRLLINEAGCYGAEIHSSDHIMHTIHARCTVLACGGLGQLFNLTTNPLSAQGEGVALAAIAGCRVHQLAFVQFHPTALAIAMNPSFLISEAVRGEGGILRNHQGERFMAHYDERLELAPRDIVARAITSEMQKSNQPHVFLDITHKSKAFITTHFPSIYQKCLQQQLDISRNWIPVAPAAHYACGGVLTDLQGRSDIRALYVVGESACTGLHGANRLASNSLLECVVLGRAAATDINQYLTNPLANWTEVATSATTAISWTTVKAALDQTKAGNNIDPIPFSLANLQKFMGQYFGIQRHNKGMQQLWQQLHYWYQSDIDHHAHKPALITALMMVYDGLQQATNHGAHYNLDLVASSA